MVAILAQMSYNKGYQNANERMVTSTPAPVLTVERLCLSMATSDSTSGTIQIPITQGFVAIIDECDSDLLAHKWHALKTGHKPYVSTNIKVNGNWKGKRLHTLIAERILARPLTSKEVVDHIDNNPLNNRRSNLRVCSVADNAKNKGTYQKNRTGLKGVYSRDGKFRAQIQSNGVKYMLGTFDTAEEAYKTYCEAAKKYHGEFARLQ